MDTAVVLRVGGRGRRLAPAAVVLVSLLAGCSNDAPSALDPRGPGAHTVAGLWWLMFWISAAVVVVVGALVVAAVLLRRRPSRQEREEPRWAWGMIGVGGVVVPVVVLALLWVLTLRNVNALSSPSRPAALTVNVVGYRWWWGVTYPQQGIVTANEIHVPVGQPVRIVLTTQDVNHSFWVPELAGKTDLIAGRTNEMWIEADRAGTYRGQCAEYCGNQHANMIFLVVAMTPRDFSGWVQQERRPHETPTDPLLARGERVMETAPCGSCHTVRGTEANGTDGPDLSDFGGRLTIGAGAAPNTPGALGGWIVNAQAIKPGNLMPPIDLTPQDLQALIAYLESLR